MKAHLRIILVGLILVLLAIHWYLFSKNEGFLDTASDYTALKSRLTTTLGNYCKLADQIHTQILKGYAGTSGVSNQAAIADVNAGYKKMYMCLDDKASSRPSCFNMKSFPMITPNKSGMAYVSSDTYLNLPAWSDDGSVSTALAKITNDLPERVNREADYFAQVIQTLQGFLNSMANPPSVAPTSEQIAALKEPFTGSCCGEKMKILQELTASCSAQQALPSPSSEIARVNKLLDNPALKAALARCDSLLKSMTSIQIQLANLSSGPTDQGKKSYEIFKGGDNTQSLIFSMKQNQ